MLVSPFCFGTLDKTMDKMTPARTIRDKDLKANSSAFVDCLGLIVDQLRRCTKPITIVDTRYGLGGWAIELVNALNQATDNVRLIGYEADPETAEKSSRVPGLKLRVKEFSRRDSLPPVVDLLMADFNNLTALKRSELDDVLGVHPTWIVFTDVACGKLHLNYRSYGLSNPSLEDYWTAFNIPGYRLVGWSRAHHFASTAVFRRTIP